MKRKCADIETRAELVVLYGILEKKGILSKKDLDEMRKEAERVGRR